MKSNKMKPSGLMGLYGCKCHPFNDLVEWKKAHKQKFNIGETVCNRHTQKVGEIKQVLKSPNGWFLVRYLDELFNVEIEHCSTLIKLKSIKTTKKLWHEFRTDHFQHYEFKPSQLG